MDIMNHFEGITKAYQRHKVVRKAFILGRLSGLEVGGIKRLSDFLIPVPHLMFFGVEIF